MIVLARLLARLVGLVLIALIAAVGIVAAVFCIGSGHGTLSLAHLAQDVRLPALRGDVNVFLSRTTADGPIAVVAALGGAAAIVLGLMLLAGSWVSPRPRRIVLAREPDGSLGSLRRPLGRLLAARAQEPAEVACARAHARSRRRHDGGRVRVIARAAIPAGSRQARGAAADAVAPVTGELPLRVQVRGRQPSRRERKEATA